MTEWFADTTIAGQLRYQAEACGHLGSPLYGALLRDAVDDFEAGGPTWEVLHGREGEPGTSALALRFMGAVNRLVLQGRAPDLAAVYDDPGPDEAAAWQAFRTVLERNVEELRTLVDRPVQTNEAGRSAALLCGFLTVAAETGLPLRLLEVGASAGLNLRWDRYRYLGADGFTWGPADSPVRIEFELRGGRFPVPTEIEVRERHGCDSAPLDPADPEGRLTLLAYVWPDQRTRVERVRAALAVAVAEPVSIDREGAATWAGRKLAEDSPGLATVLYHSVVAQYLSEGELSEFEGHVREAGERASAEAPLAWLRMEAAGKMADLRLATWPGGEDRLLARVGYHGSPVELLP